MFAEQISKTFGQYLEDGVIKCNEQIFREGLRQIISEYESTEKPKRKKTNFMLWLDENRQSIKTRYFNDFDDQEDWSKTATLEYYSSKSLPLTKITELIESKIKRKNTV